MNDPDIVQTPADGECRAGAPGGRLAAAREAQGLTAADVARQLKLSVSQVEALEAGRYEQLPGPIFVRGFIRNYARLVKQDPEELLRNAAETLPHPAPRPETPPSPEIPFPGGKRSQWQGYAAIAVAIVAFLVFYEFYWVGDESTVVVSKMAVAPVPESSTAQTGSATPAPAAIFAGSSAGESVVQEPPGITVAAAAATARDVPPVDEPAAAIDAERAPRQGERVVRLVFEKESWVEIRDRTGTAILFKLNPPGTVREVSGLPPLTVVVGNAHGVRMRYDNRPVDLAPHTNIDVARLTLE